MFESVTEAKKSEGLRGFQNRHFGPVVDAELALDGIRDIALVLIGFSCVSAVFGWFAVGPIALIVSAILAVPAVILRFTPSRVAACILLALTALNAVLSIPRVVPWIWVLFALRGVQLTFGYHRVRRVQAQVDNFE